MTKMANERKPDLIDAIVKMCRERGHTVPVSAETYQAFIEMDDGAATQLIKLLVRENAGLIKRGSDKALHDDPNAEVTSRIETQLRCIAGGIMRLDPHRKVVFVAPDGPEPDAMQYEAIEQRIEKMLPLVARAIHEMQSSGAN